ncbi:hypothetical protein CVT25_004726 [Psilocybe cyanescens]|uniref:Uncharacterized protein n=1 Tax=Psilocybe cyanescens TaxID=93625 RepID=A0A409XRG5_PSICY|nr:hypothetical protein CVT25_004726 [Psilocybe cyanescens]
MSSSSIPSATSSLTSSTSPAPSVTVVPDKLGNYYGVSQLKMLIIGLFLSAVLYGMLLVLSWTCFILLSPSTPSASSQRNSGTSRHRRLTLLCFISFMCILGTVAFIVNVMVPINLFLTPVDEILKLTIVAIDILVAPAGSLDLSLTVLATWGSHGFLGIPRFKNIAFKIFLLLIGTTELAFGAMGLATMSFAVPWSPLSMIDTFEVISLSINVILSTLLISRIMYHQWHLRKVFGAAHGSTYNKIVMICVESSIMTVILDVLLLISFEVPVSNDTSLLPMDRTSSFKFMYYKLLVYFNAIAPILIIVRVARGKTNPSDLVESSSKTGELEAGRRGAISTLRFQVNTVINVDDPESLSMNGEKYENLDAADVEDMGFRQFQLSMKSQPVRVPPH